MENLNIYVVFFCLFRNNSSKTCHRVGGTKGFLDQSVKREVLVWCAVALTEHLSARHHDLPFACTASLHFYSSLFLSGLSKKKCSRILGGYLWRKDVCFSSVREWVIFKIASTFKVLRNFRVRQQTYMFYYQN